MSFKIAYLILTKEQKVGFFRELGWDSLWSIYYVGFKVGVNLNGLNTKGGFV